MCVGDKPSAENIFANVAFLGTKSGVNLGKWLEIMDIDHVAVSNSDSNVDLFRIEKAFIEGYKIVALGNNASKRLKKLNIAHFKLPHPSPRNRQLNDRNFILNQLDKCSDYLGLKTEEYRAFRRFQKEHMEGLR
jgi:hypothetical protein